MISSRPDTPIAASLDPTPARPTASLMASTTLGGSLIVPSAIASGGSDAPPNPISDEPWSCTTFTALDPMSRPNVYEVRRKNGMLNIDFHSFTSIGVHPTSTNVLGTRTLVTSVLN